MDMQLLYELTLARAESHAKMAGTLAGHMMNAICDLDSGTKEDAKRTLLAGIKIYDDQQAEIRARIGVTETTKGGF